MYFPICQIEFTPTFFFVSMCVCIRHMCTCVRVITFPISLPLGRKGESFDFILINSVMTIDPSARLRRAEVGWLANLLPS